MSKYLYDQKLKAVLDVKLHIVFEKESEVW